MGEGRGQGGRTEDGHLPAVTRREPRRGQEPSPRRPTGDPWQCTAHGHYRSGGWGVFTFHSLFPSLKSKPGKTLLSRYSIHRGTTRNAGAVPPTPPVPKGCWVRTKAQSTRARS